MRVRLVFILLAAMCAASCADGAEPNSRAFVTCLAMDYADGAYTAAMTAAALKDDKGGGKEAFAEGRGADAGAALAEAGGRLAGKPWTGHVKVIVLGDGLLKDAGALAAAVFSLEGEADINAAAPVAAALQAGDTLNPEKNNGGSPAAYLPDYYAAHKPAPKTTLGELAAALRAGRAFSLPRLAPGETAPTGVYAKAGEAAEEGRGERPEGAPKAAPGLTP